MRFLVEIPVYPQFGAAAAGIVGRRFDTAKGSR
jgi:hypothetical protein